ncbi:MAG: low molecular weight phosphotyrosine protein phosphatase, partial [Bacteroidales bacterium]|nr:low molecular weight phosphotyrosine protein phosphatase [Bacteroidales bacterium]
DAGLDLEIASCGLISYHTGESPDSRMMQTARRRGYPLNHRARKIEERDFGYYDMIIGMDGENLTKLRQLCPSEHKHKLHIMSEYFVDIKNFSTVPDPYYGDMDDFDQVITLLEDACGGLIGKLKG